MTPIAPHITAYLRERLPLERQASRHTTNTYTYAFKLLFEFTSTRLGVSPSSLTLEHLDAQLVLDFLAHLQSERGNGARTRNSRLIAIKSFMRFVEYRVPSASLPAPALDTLDGNLLAGIPSYTARLGARWALGGFVFDVEETRQGASWGNDANTVRVADWGRGQLNVRASWRGLVRGHALEPFVALQNALDERYVGAVTLNGFGGRVLEPAPGRNWFAGLEIGVPLLR